jgi:hypothetical protein
VYPANGALSALLGASHNRFAVLVRLKNLFRTKGNADVAGLAPTEIDFQGRWSLGVIILTLSGRFGF